MSGAAHHAVQAQGVWKIFNEGQSGEVTALQDGTTRLRFFIARRAEPAS